ncbi:MAG: type II secretion system protein [Parcubacteria group bacterium]|jgi:type II secretory pathway pseudopilin PulG
MKSKINNNLGFSLLEVFITLMIAGFALVLFQTALGKTKLVQYAKNQEIALRVANNKIEELRSGGYSALPSTGSFFDSQLNDLPNSSANMAITDFNDDTKQVIITVQWQDPASTSSKTVSLATLVTKTGGL